MAADDIGLIALKDIPGIYLRTAEGYRTRRLKAGDEFFAAPGMARVLMGAKKAALPRKPGRIPAPAAAVLAKVQAAEVPDQPSFDVVYEPEPSAPEEEAKAVVEEEEAPAKPRRGRPRRAKKTEDE